MDQKFRSLLNNQDDEVTRELNKLNSQSQAALRKAARGDEINDTEELLKKIALISSSFAVAMAIILRKYNKEALLLNMNNSAKPLYDLLKGSSIVKTQRKLIVNRIENEGNSIYKTILNRKFPGTNKTINDRLKTVRDGYTRTVRNIIFDAQNNGEGVFEIAKKIEQYVIPTINGKRVAPWTIARRALGKGISYVPRGIPAGSVSYNSYRIAATETAYTYQQASDKFSDLWYVKGHKWSLSAIHPKKDTCDEYAAHDEGLGRGVWKKIPMIPHPFCFCRTTPTTMSEKEFNKQLKKRGLI